jgi:hypothetical protein
MIITLDKLYFRNHLFQVEAVFMSSDYDAIRRALVAKYGPPSTDVPGKWQNQLGGTFDKTTSYWLFEGGLLELDSIGDKLDEAKFRFVSSQNAPPKAPPVVDF